MRIWSLFQLLLFLCWFGYMISDETIPSVYVDHGSRFYISLSDINSRLFGELNPYSYVVQKAIDYKNILVNFSGDVMISDETIPSVYVDHGSRFYISLSTSLCLSVFVSVIVSIFLSLLGNVIQGITRRRIYFEKRFITIMDFILENKIVPAMIYIVFTNEVTPILMVCLILIMEQLRSFFEESLVPLSNFLLSCRLIFGVARMPQWNSIRLIVFSFGFFVEKAYKWLVCLLRGKSGAKANMSSKAKFACLQKLGIKPDRKINSTVISCIQFLASVPAFIDIMKNSQTPLGLEFANLVTRMNNMEDEGVSVEKFLKELDFALIYRNRYFSRTGIPISALFEKCPNMDVGRTIELLLLGLHNFLNEPLRSQFNALFRHETVDKCETCTSKRLTFYVCRGDWGEFSYEPKFYPCPYCHSQVERMFTVVPVYSIVTEFSGYRQYIAKERYPECGRTAQVIFKESIRSTSVTIKGFGACYYFCNENSIANPFNEKRWTEKLNRLDLEDVVVFTSAEFEPTLHAIPQEMKKDCVKIDPIGDTEEEFIDRYGIRIARFRNTNGICSLITTFTCLLQLPIRTIESIIRSSPEFDADCSLRHSLGTILDHWRIHGSDQDSVHPIPSAVVKAALAAGGLAYDDYQYGAKNCTTVIDSLLFQRVHPGIIKKFISIRQFKKGEDSLIEMIQESPISIILFERMTVDDVIWSTHEFEGMRVMTIERSEHAGALLIPNNSNEYLVVDNSDLKVHSLLLPEMPVLQRTLKTLQCGFLISIKEGTKKDLQTTKATPKPERKASIEMWLNHSDDNKSGHIDQLPFFADWEIDDSTLNEENEDPPYDYNGPPSALCYDHANGVDNLNMLLDCTDSESGDFSEKTQSTESSTTESTTTESISNRIDELNDDNPLNSSDDSFEYAADSDTISTLSDIWEKYEIEVLFGRAVHTYTMAVVYRDALKFRQDPRAPPDLISRIPSSSFYISGLNVRRFLQKLKCNTTFVDDGICVQTIGMERPIFIGNNDIRSFLCMHRAISIKHRDQMNRENRKDFLQNLFGKVLCDHCCKDPEFSDELMHGLNVIGKIRTQPFVLKDHHKIIDFTKDRITFENFGRRELTVSADENFIQFVDVPVLEPNSRTTLKIKIFELWEAEEFENGARIKDIIYGDKSKENVIILRTLSDS